MSIHSLPPVRHVSLGALDMTVEHRENGVIHVRSPASLPPYESNFTVWLDHWAQHAGDRLFLAERDAQGRWQGLTYGQALAQVRGVAQALLGRDLSPERPVAILSGNAIDHAVLGLAAMYIGVPYAPISTAYSLVSSDFAKLKQILGLLTPGLVFAQNGLAYAKAIEAAVPHDVELVVSDAPTNGRPATAFAALAATPVTPALDVAHAAVGLDTITKFLFTSGSTALPKGVINTQRMWCSNQAMESYFMPFLVEQPPVFLDWLPWNHTYGGNHNFGMTLKNGGTLYIDEGKPTPAGIEATVRNLRDIAPTIYFNVPKGFESLIPYLRADASLAKHFFSRLNMNCFAGAGLAQHVFDALDEIAVATCGERIFMLSGFGATETAPSSFYTTIETSRSGGVGLPLPGIEVKLVPNAEKLEARIKGPNVTPGYWRQAEITRAAFDEDGYYSFGDALRFADESTPKRGLFFDGRVTEDFKLATGTWVSVGPLRARFIQACAPYVKDAVIAGHNEADVAVLVFPDFEVCRALAHETDLELRPEAHIGEVLAHPAVCGKFQALLAAFAEEATGSSSRVNRAILIDEFPSIDANEITDKGSINQRAVLKHRAALVSELYCGSVSPRVIAI